MRKFLLFLTIIGVSLLLYGFGEMGMGYGPLQPIPNFLSNLNIIDSGIPPHDSGVPDTGIHPDATVIPLLVMTSPSYAGSLGGTPQTAQWTTPYPCANDAGTCAWQVIDGSVSEAIDDSNGAAAAIGAIQYAAAMTGDLWVGVVWAKPQTPPQNYVVQEIKDNITAAAAWAQTRGWELCPRIHLDVVGGYYGQSQQLPFLDSDAGAGADAASHEAIMVFNVTHQIEAHLTSLVGSGVSSLCTNLIYADVAGPTSGNSVDAQVPKFYSGDFNAYTEANPTEVSAPILSTIEWGVQSDGLHFNVPGMLEAAQGFALIFARAWQDNYPTPFYPTATTLVDNTTIDVTFKVPCRVHGTCSTDPPLIIDTTHVSPRESDHIVTYGLHFFLGGVQQTPPSVVSVTPQACAGGSTECDMRWVFSAPFDFDTIIFADNVCKIYPVVECSFGPLGVAAGGSNVGSLRIDNCINPLDGGAGDVQNCIERPGGNTFAVNSIDAGPDAGVDSGVSDSGVSDAGFTASNLQYLAATNGNYTTIPNQGGGSSQCVTMWADHPGAGEKIFNPTTNLRFYIGMVSGSMVCATTNTPGVTDRAWATLPSENERHFYACCWDDATDTINLWLDGASDNGTVIGTGTALNADNLTLIPANPGASFPQSVDEVLVLVDVATLSAQDILDIRCATKAATDTSPTAGECASANIDISHICGLGGAGSYWLGFEGDGTNRCGGTNATIVGSPSFPTY